MDVNALVAQAKATENLEDQSVTKEGGFEYETPPAGPTPARFVGYIELGKRKQPDYQGQSKADCEEVRLEFELNGPKHQREVEIEGEGKKTFTNRISVNVTKKFGEKAGFKKLFNKMTYGRDITHMAQMLGEGFIITVVQNVSKKNGKTYANMKDNDGVWTIGAPSVADPLSGETKAVPVPEPTQALKLLLWDNPTKEQWDSIFIDGTRTVKDEKGQEREVSKNWMQESIVTEAVNFEGSALQAMLGGVGDMDLNPEPVADKGEPEKEPEPVDPAPETDKQDGAEEKPAAATADADDLMASLGLT